MRKTLQNLCQIVRMPFCACPVYAGAMFAIRMLSGIIPVTKLFFMARFLDNVIAYLSYRESLSMLYAGIFLCVIIFEKISRSVESYISANLKEAIWKKTTDELIGSWANTKFEVVEDEKNYIIYERVKDKAHEQIYKSYVNLMSFASLIINIAVIVIYILIHSVLAGMGVIFLFAVLTVVSIHGGKIEYKASVDAKKAKVKVDYFDNILQGKEAASERKIYSYEKEINNFWEKYFLCSSNVQLKAEKAFLKQYQMVGIGGTIISILMMFVFACMLQNHKISYGIFAALVANIVSLTKEISSSINLQIRNLVQAVNYIKDYKIITNLPKEEIMFVEDIDFNKIEIKNLKFQYPHSTMPVLNGINLVIERGKKYAIIGENGAGKTTLIKILTGLYRNYEGNVLIDGNELKEHPEYYSLFGAVFQDYAKYNMSLRDNLIIGKRGKEPDEQLIDRTINKYGLTYLKTKLSKGIHTMLGRQLQGSEELSGGEWQKVALARLDLSGRKVKVLDEPTASLDPISESEIFNIFFHNHGKDTFLVISHRLGITTLVDRIFILADGRICEEGNSKDLLNKSGIFKKMFEEQKVWYTL